MNPGDREFRKRVAVLARTLLEGKLSHEQFINGLDDTGDEDVSELEYLLEHLPARGGFFGASEKQYSAHMANIETVIRKLETS